MSSVWIETVCVLTFDEDIGPQVELQHPPLLSPEEQRKLSFLAFPDSNSINSEADLTYTFKLKTASQVLFGYTYFRQKRDSSRTRGFFQKSLVLLSTLPYINLFQQVLDIVGPVYFDHGHDVFEVVENCFSSWGQPQPGLTLELPMLGHLIVYTIPAEDAPQAHQPAGDGLSEVLDSFHQGLPGMFQDVNVCEAVGKSVKHLWALWELALCGETVLIVSDSPRCSSSVVLSVLSLISPLQYAGEYYPYFTIFDQEFKTLNAETPPKFIGVTNPFFIQALGDNTNVFQFETKGAQVEAVTCNLRVPTSINKVKPILTQLLTNESKEALAINNSLLKSHFRALTAAVLEPFEQFFRVNAVEILKNPYERQVLFKSFTDNEFLRDLSSSRSKFGLLKYTSRQKAVKLYSRFLRSSTFRLWFARKRQDASERVHEIIQEGILAFDVKRVAQNLDQLGMQNLYRKMESQLKYEESKGNSEALTELKKQLSELISVMTGSSRDDLYKVLS